MAAYEAIGQSDDWYTPKYIFEALGCTFDLDPANGAFGSANVPCKESWGLYGLDRPWHGFVWLNPPFGHQKNKFAWLRKFFDHGNGIALMPDRTSAPWWQEAVKMATSTLFIDGKVKFERPDGSVGQQPGTGTCLFAAGDVADGVLQRAEMRRLGVLMVRHD